MKNFVIIEEVEVKEFERVKFYSIKIDDYIMNEFERFNMKCRESDNEKLRDEFYDIVAVIEEIGDNYAKLKYFREENAAFALPPSSGTKVKGVSIETDTKLRLYCVLLSEEIVILCNGGWKTENRAQDCPNVSTHFRFAGKLANYINKNRSDLLVSGEGILVGEDNGFYI